MSHVCPVCGYPDLSEPARSENGYPSYEYCQSCGFQFGWTDDDQGISYEDWRQMWIAKGMPWAIAAIRKPKDWNPAENLKNLKHN